MKQIGRFIRSSTLPLFVAALISVIGANASACGLALVLAADASPSVDGREFRLQIEGYAAALRDPETIKAIKANGPGGIIITLTLWSNHEDQRQVVPWTRVHDVQSADAMAGAIERIRWPRPIWGTGTAIGSAMQHAATLLAETPYKCTRRVIDVSGDGTSIVGPSPARVRDVLVPMGITINGIAIRADEGPGEPGLDVYYAENVIGGHASFVISAASYEDFKTAIRIKMKREIQPGQELRARLERGQ